MAYKQRKVLALVPARGGSKGVPKKNLRVIKGRPLIAHTIEAALGSTVIDRVFVSSDDDEILRTGAAMGVEVIRRSAATASDSATASMVVFDFINRMPSVLVEENPFLVYLQPTSPLRTSAHIDAAFREMEISEMETCISVVMLKRTPYKSFKLSSAGLLLSLFDEALSNANRQVMPVTYYPNGALYIFPISEFVTRRGFPSNGCLPFVMSEDESIDIDTEEDITTVENYGS
jgi:CMP-N,N'-diacetyllegionaminic acid synthase